MVIQLVLFSVKFTLHLADIFLCKRASNKILQYPIAGTLIIAVTLALMW